MATIAVMASPFNDVGRFWGRVAAAGLDLAAIGLWVLFAHLLKRAEDWSPPLGRLPDRGFDTWRSRD